MVDRLTEGESHTFVVLGTPAPGGSKTARPVMRGGKAVLGANGRPVIALRPSSKFTKPWMTVCAAIYKSDWGDYPPIDAPFQVDIVFYFDRPGYADWDDWPLKSGNDNDKLERATLDPLGGVKGAWAGAIKSDRRIVKLSSERRFGLPERAEVTLTRLPLKRVEPVEVQEALAV